MITLAFITLMLVVFIRLFIIAIKLTWGITKITFFLVLLPLFLICGFIAGAVKIVFPVLILFGIISFIVKPRIA